MVALELLATDIASFSQDLRALVLIFRDSGAARATLTLRVVGGWDSSLPLSEAMRPQNDHKWQYKKSPCTPSLGHWTR